MPESLPISEAAQRLGISVDALRKKIRRGTVRAVKRDNRWYVEVPDVDTAQDSGHAASRPPLDGAISRELVDMIRAELDAKNRQIERLTVLLGNAQQTVQLLTASNTEAPESFGAVAGDGSRPRAGSDDSGTAQVRPRSWWRRLWEG